MWHDNELKFCLTCSVPGLRPPLEDRVFLVTGATKGHGQCPNKSTNISLALDRQETWQGLETAARLLDAGSTVGNLEIFKQPQLFGLQPEFS